MSQPYSDTVRWQLWIVAIGFFMQTLDTTIVNTALPAMAASLNENPLRMHSVIVSYVLTVAIMLPASGWLADRIGTQRIFICAIVLFTLGSLLCAAAQTLNQLVFYRIIQGIGGAMMVPVGRLIVMKLVPRSQFMAAMTLVTIPGQIGPLFGPTLGGFLVEYVSWHWIFLINIPVGIIGVLTTLRFMPNQTSDTPHFDFRGFILLAFGMACVTLALDGDKGSGFSGTDILLLIIVSCALFAGYILHARHSSRALFPLSLLKNKAYAITLTGSLFARIGSGMLPFITPLFLQLGMGYTPFESGMMMIPLVIGSMCMKRQVVNIVNRFGFRYVLIGDTLLLALVCAVTPFVVMVGWIWLLPVVLFLQGMINSLRFSAMNAVTLQALTDEQTSSGNTLLSMVMQLSMSLGVSVMGLLLATFGQQHMATDSVDMQQTFIYCYLSMALIVALPAWVFTRIEDDRNTNQPLRSKSGDAS